MDDVAITVERRIIYVRHESIGGEACMTLYMLATQLCIDKLTFLCLDPVCLLLK